LQERVIERVGGVKQIPVDVRVVCATHQNIQQQIDQNLFREDLYYRVSEITLNIPPIRDREGDAIIIAQALLKNFVQQMQRPKLTFSDDAMRAIKSYNWPGNVREIINKVKRAVIMADEKVISAADLELNNSSEMPEEALNLRHIRDSAEKMAIIQALQAAQNNMAKAARLLGITRPTLYNLTEKFGIHTGSVD
jgi:two-component system NtrC family response regulator